MEQKRAIATLAALAQDSRMDIFRLLVRQGPEGLPAGEIAERLGVAPATLSFHLAQLSHAGLLTSRRQSRSIRLWCANGRAGGVLPGAEVIRQPCG